MACISENDQHALEFLNACTVGRGVGMVTSFISLLRLLAYDGTVAIYGCSGQASLVEMIRMPCKLIEAIYQRPGKKCTGSLPVGWN